MGVLDRQSIRDRAQNRRLGERALQERQKLRQDAAERRRPDRGRGNPPKRRVPSRRGRAAERFEGAVHGLAVALLLPVQLLVLLLQPMELIRRLRSAPDRIEARTRRLRMQSRDPDTTAGRVRETARLSAHFMREEVADMQDGFPRLRDVVAGSLGLIEAGALRTAQGVGLIDKKGDPDESRERLFRGVALGLVASAALIGLFVSIYQAVDTLKQHERLTLTDVHVSGLHRVSEADVLGQMSIPGGANLLELPLERFAVDVQELPWVESAHLARDIRTQSLTVQVAERRPALILGSGGLHLVDESGVVFKPLETGDPSDLPLLSAAPEEVPAAARAALDLLHALSSGQAVRAEDVSELRWHAVDGITLVTRAGLPIRLGRQNYPARLSRLERAVAAGGLPLDALAEIDAALRDRVVAVPLSRPKARKQVAERIKKQPVKQGARALMLHLQRVTADDDADLFGGGTP
jgi:cell division septal protein FtsQ